MAKIEMKGLDEYTRAISQLALRSKLEVCGPAIHDAADVVADAIREEMEALPTDYGRGGFMYTLQGPNKVQKHHLLQSFGIAPLRDDNGFINVKLGWTGYNPIRTKRWPRGQPNAMVARSVERGTSFMSANPFVKKAISKARKKSIAVMRARVDERLHAIMDNGTMG